MSPADLTPEQRRQLDTLLSNLCDGRLTSTQQAELNVQLRASSSARLHYLQYVDLHARLSVHPHLSSGIGYAAATSAAEQPADSADQMVLELADRSLQQYANSMRQSPRENRKWLAVGWLAITVAILLMVYGWNTFAPWQNHASYPLLSELTGKATVESMSQTRSAVVGERLRPGESLSMAAGDSQAVLIYADGTKIIIDGDSRVTVPVAESGEHLRLVAGTMDVDAAPQQAGKPLIFATDHARYVVLGTRFRLYREADASRLELNEGKVRLEPESRAESVEVSAGFVAVASPNQASVDVHPMITGQSDLILSYAGKGRTVAFGPGQDWLATNDGDHGLNIWNLEETLPQHTLPGKFGHGYGIAVSAEELIVNVGQIDRQGVITIWDAGKSKSRRITLPGKTVRSRAISPDGAFAAEGTEGGTYVYRLDLQRAKLNLVAQLPGPGKPWCLGLSPKGEYAAAGFWDGTVRLYQLSHGAHPTGLEAQVVFERKLQHTVTKLAISFDGTKLAVFSRHDGLLLINTSTQHEQQLWAAGAADAACIRFSADGQFLLAGLNDRTARMWSAVNGTPCIVVDVQQVPRDIAWSPKRSLLATMGGNLKVWHCKTSPVETNLPVLRD